MVRISIPTLPALKLPLPFNPLADYSPVKAATHLKSFLNQGEGKTLVMTGAGVSVESGIRAYRGSEGHCELLSRIMLSWRHDESELCADLLLGVGGHQSEGRSVQVSKSVPLDND
jgi:hypothetical protein